MFRKKIMKLYHQLSNAVLDGVKVSLLSSIKYEKVAHVRRKIADTIGDFGGLILKSGSWPEIINFMILASKSGPAEQREAAMIALVRLGPAAGDKLVPSLSVLCDALQSCLQDSSSPSVRASALAATSSIARSLAGQEQRLQSLAPAMLAAVGSALNADDQPAARAGLEALIAAAGSAPRVLRAATEALLAMGFAIVDADDRLEPATRFLAVELLLTLAERCPAAMRR